MERFRFCSLRAEPDLRRLRQRYAFPCRTSTFYNTVAELVDVSTARSAADLLSPILSAKRPTMSDLFIRTLPSAVARGVANRARSCSMNPTPAPQSPAVPERSFTGSVHAPSFESTPADLPVDFRIARQYRATLRIPIPIQADCGAPSAL